MFVNEELTSFFLLLLSSKKNASHLSLLNENGSQQKVNKALYHQVSKLEKYFKTHTDFRTVVYIY